MNDNVYIIKGDNCIMDKVSASQPLDCGFEPHMGHNHDFSYDTSTVGSRSRLNSDLNKLWELASQSSWNK